MWLCEFPFNKYVICFVGKYVVLLVADVYIETMFLVLKHELMHLKDNCIERYSNKYVIFYEMLNIFDVHETYSDNISSVTIIS